MLRWILTHAGALFLASFGTAQASNRIFQLTSVSLGRAIVEIDWYSMPGSALAAAIFDRIDTDRDGKVSESEGQAYAKVALRNITLIVDGKPRTLLVRHVSISDRKQMLTGAGSIDFLVYTEIPERLGRHTFAFENRYRRSESKFRTATLNDPADKSLRIVSQRLEAGGARLHLTYILDKAPTFR